MLAEWAAVGAVRGAGPRGAGVTTRIAAGAPSRKSVHALGLGDGGRNGEVAEGPAAEATNASVGDTRTTNGVVAEMKRNGAATATTKRVTTEADGARAVLAEGAAAATGVGVRGLTTTVGAPVALAGETKSRKRCSATGVLKDGVQRAGHPSHGAAAETPTGVAGTRGSDL